MKCTEKNNALKLLHS